MIIRSYGTGSRPGIGRKRLPLGNGRLGAMLFSGVEEDVLMINEDTLWSGYPKDTIVQDAYVHYQKARDLALEKRYEEAEREIEENLTGEFTDSYLPLGKVCMRFPAFAQGVPDTYERSRSCGRRRFSPFPPGRG